MVGTLARMASNKFRRNTLRTLRSHPAAREMILSLEPRTFLTADYTVNGLAVTTTSGSNHGLYQVDYNGRTLFNASATEVANLYDNATTNGVIYPEAMRVKTSGGNSYFLNHYDNFKQSTTTASTWNSTTHTLTQTFEAYFDPNHPVYDLGGGSHDSQFVVFGNSTYRIGTVTVTTVVEADPLASSSRARLSFSITTSEASGSPVSITGVMMNVDGLNFGTQGEPTFAPSNIGDGGDKFISDSPERPAVIAATLTSGGSETGIVAVADDESRSTHSTASDAPFGGDKPRFEVMQRRGTGTNGANTVQLGNFYNVNYFGSTTFGTPLSQGGSDTMHFSIRFGPSGTSLQTVASDVFSNYASYYSAQTVSNDRRPMMDTFLALEGMRGTENPNGFINYTWPSNALYPYHAKPSGMSDTDWTAAKNAWWGSFASTLISRAQTTVSRLQAIGGRGAVTWDLEGYQYDYAKYIGDPTAATTIAPELDWVDPNTTNNPDGFTVAKRYFKVFADAGLSCGMTVRAQQLATDPTHGYTQLTVDSLNDMVDMLVAKIGYAKDHWGCKLFYIDSDQPFMDSYVYKRVQDSISDVVIMPENQNTGDYAYTAPYDQLVNGKPAGTPDIVRQQYPNAFSVFSVIAHGGEDPLTDTESSTVYQSVSAAVAAGDVTMASDWDPNYDSNHHYAAIRKIYKDVYGQVSFPSRITTGQPYTITLGPGAAGRALMGSTWTIDWGDGTTDTITYTSSNYPTSGATASHSYAAASAIRHISATFNLNASVSTTKTSTYDLPAYMTASSGATFAFTGSSGSRTLELQSGTFTFVGDAGTAESGLSLTVDAGATANVSASQHFGTVTLNAASGALAAGRLAMGGLGLPVLSVNALSIVSGAKLDVGTGDLIVNYTGTSPASTIRSLITSGRNSGTWDGAGINSTAAHDDSNHLTSVGYAEAADLGLSDIDGVSIPGDAVIVKYLENGDITLDGSIDSTDVTQFCYGYANSGSTWIDCDYDYSGDVDLSDFDMLLAGYKDLSGDMTDFQQVVQTSGYLSVAQISTLLNRINLDTTFGGDGLVTTDVSGNRDFANAVASASSGKTYAAGQVQGSGAWDFGIVRYNSDGSLDTGFSSDGMAATSITSNADVGWAIAVQSNGKPVVAGGSNQVWATSGDFAVVRYNTDGSLDTGFDSDGIVTTDISGSGSLDVAYAVAVDGSGNIVVAGTNGSDFAVVRYTSSGALDTSFNSTGIKTIDFGSSSEEAHSLAIDGSGNIVVAGTSGNYIATARLTSSGSLDTSFSSDGKDTVQVQGTSSGYGVGIQSSGKIVVTGYTYNGTSNDFWDIGMVRYNTNGTLDTSFGTGGTGKVQTNMYSDSNIAKASFVMSNDKIVVCGNIGNHDFSGESSDFAVARYNANGTLDTSFAGIGYMTTDFGFRDEAFAVTVDANGCIVLAGLTNNHVSTSAGEDFALLRLKANP